MYRLFRSTLAVLNLKNQLNSSRFSASVLNRSRNISCDKASKSATPVDVKSSETKNLDSGEEVRFGTGRADRYVKLDPASNQRRRSQQKQSSTRIDDPDQFGTLTNTLDDIGIPVSRVKEEAEEKSTSQTEKKYDQTLNHIRLSNDPRCGQPNSEEYYVKKIEALAEQNKTREVLNVFFLEMIERDRFRPTLFLYKVTIRHLARVGYTHMAFSLFKMLNRSHDANWEQARSRDQLHRIVSLLLTGCARSPWPEYAVRKTDSIRVYLKNRHIKPNLVNYQAMISAYGRAGAIYEAFNCVDELCEAGLRPDQSIYTNLLCACISQPDYGFKYAIMTWQMCLKSKVIPSLFMYNLLLRSVHDCSYGEMTTDKKKPKIFEFNVTKMKRICSADLFPSKNANNSSSIGSYDEFRVDHDLNAAILLEKIGSDDPKRINKRVSNMNNLILGKIEELDNSDDKSQTELISLREDDVCVVDEFKVAAEALGERIGQLEWWQDIKTSVDREELARIVTSTRNPDLRNSLSEKSVARPILTENEQVLVRVLSEEVLKRKFSSQIVAGKVDKNSHDTPLARLNALGGVTGIFAALAKHRVKPDFKLFNQLVRVCNSDTATELDLLKRMSAHNLKPDVDFINFLIKKRINRRRFDEANLAFQMLGEHQLAPNIRTFGCLAHGIVQTHTLVQFLKDLKSMNFELNIVLITHLYNNGINKKNIKFLELLFKHIIENRVMVTCKIFEHIRNDEECLRRSIVKTEKNNLKALNEDERNEYKAMTSFHRRLKELRLDLEARARVEQQTSHPYSKFGDPNKSESSQDRLYQSHLRESNKMIMALKNSV